MVLKIHPLRAKTSSSTSRRLSPFSSLPSFRLSLSLSLSPHRPHLCRSIDSFEGPAGRECSGPRTSKQHTLISTVLLLLFPWHTDLASHTPSSSEPRQICVWVSSCISVTFLLPRISVATLTRPCHIAKDVQSWPWKSSRIFSGFCRRAQRLGSNRTCNIKIKYAEPVRAGKTNTAFFKSEHICFRYQLFLWIVKLAVKLYPNLTDPRGSDPSLTRMMLWKGLLRTPSVNRQTLCCFQQI